MKVKKVRIKKFRHMHKLEVEIGDNLTVISGQNGTGKSTILGMIGHVFDYKGKEKTKNNNDFNAKYGEIFRFCPEYDLKTKHEYTVHLVDESGDTIIRDAKSRSTTETVKKSWGKEKKERFRIDIGDRHKKGEASIDFPVIYLGLKRLFPLSSEEEDSIKVKEIKLSSEEKSIYDKYARDILILLERKINPQDVEAPTKEFLAMKTPKYSYYGNSAGQDNIGQLLTAILSFKELKRKKGSAYKGGILLIDEVDATLYAGSQINLVKKLFKFSNDYSLQIIFTTHSLEILELLKEKTQWNSKINFFETRNGKVKNIIDPSFSDIENKILVQTARKGNVIKIDVLCEDRRSELWCKNLLEGSDVKKFLNVNGGPLGCGDLKKLSKAKPSAFRKMIYVLDGDAKEDNRKFKNTVFLPGCFSPEKEMYRYLRELDEEDEFWDNEMNFDKQVCFNNYLGPQVGDYKNWFEEGEASFGRGCSRLFNRWKKDHVEDRDLFVESIKRIAYKLK